MTETTHIALVCPGGPITPELTQEIDAIAAKTCGGRAKLTVHPQCFAKAGHFAGDDAARSKAFLEVANDSAFDAVWFARGGYGAGRLDEAIYDEMNEAARAKTYLGYSDNGYILARLFARGIGRPVHGPIPTDLPRENGAEAITRSLLFLTGDESVIEPNAAATQTLAFNITVAAHFIGLDWAPSMEGRVVMLEDIGEYLYAIDRSMQAILMSPKMQGAKGVMLGRVSGVPENDRPFGASAEEIAQYWCVKAGIDYLGRADIGHDGENKIVPFR